MNKTERSSIRLIIVDSDTPFRESLTAMIRSSPDVEVVGQTDCVHEAIELARTFKPDIVLMDFSLPDGTGVDAMRAILKESPACKIVFLTTSEVDEDLFTAIKSGARGYLLKDIPPSKLISALHSV